MKFKKGDEVHLSEEGRNIRIPDMRRWKGTIDGWDQQFQKYWVIWKRCEHCNSPTKRWLTATEDLILYVPPKWMREGDEAAQDAPGHSEPCQDTVGTPGEMG